MKVLVFGTVCLDRLRTVGSIPEPGGYVEILDEELFLGGEAANTACALHEWGVSIALMPNPIGTDEAGRFIAFECNTVGTVIKRKNCLQFCERTDNPADSVGAELLNMA